MYWIFFALISLLLNSAKADTMENYINISNQIPQMEMKANAKAQAWAHSARTVITLTNESIAETLLQANYAAKTQGTPLFCLPPGKILDAAALNDIILKTYNSINSQTSDKNKMTVSQVAWLGVTSSFPCSLDYKEERSSPLSTQVNTMEHIE